MPSKASTQLFSCGAYTTLQGRVQVYAAGQKGKKIASLLGALQENSPLWRGFVGGGDGQQELGAADL